MYVYLTICVILLLQCSDSEFTSFNKKKVQITKYCSKRTEILVREKVTTLEHNSL